MGVHVSRLPPLGRFGGNASIGRPVILRALPADVDREKGRIYRRTVFYKRDWEQHRSIARYFNALDGIPSSRIVRGLLPPLVCILLTSYIVCLYEELWLEGMLDVYLPFIPWPDLAVSPDGPFSISTFALSLLLVFRTNSSYERWSEASIAWNVVVSATCHLARQTCQWLPGSSAAEEQPRRALLRWLQAFPLAMMCHLREEEEKLPGLLQGVLLPEEQTLLLRSPSPPSSALTVIGSLISTSCMTIDSKTHMDESVRRLQEAYSSCERIVRTPLPLSYSRHTSRFLVTWLTFLPFCAWKELGWATVPVDLILGFFLLGIEEIGVQVEEPLGILALDHYCATIQERVTQMEEEHEAVLQLKRDTMQGALRAAGSGGLHAAVLSMPSATNSTHMALAAAATEQ